MATNLDSFISLRSTGTSGHLTRYADGRFLSVWTDLDMNGSAYVYGQLFNADGTASGQHFLIDYTARASYREITAETLSDGRTVVAWVKSDGSGAAVVGKVLGTNMSASGALLTFSPNATSEEAPELHALSDGSFAVLYRGSGTFENGAFTGLIANICIPAGAGWISASHGGIWPLPNDGTNSTAFMADGSFVAAMVVPNTTGGGANLYVLLPGPNGPVDFPVDFISGDPAGVQPSIAAYGFVGFIVAWSNNSVIKTQVYRTTGQPVGETFSFDKPDGVLKGNPVIKAFADGGFAIAFVVETNGDENVYTAGRKADGTMIATTLVGANTAGDQWDPSITELSGGTYAVSWQSDGESGLPNQYIVEVIGREGQDATAVITPGSVGEPPPPPPPPPGTTWTGTNGNDTHIGSSLSETFYGLGGKDKIRAGGGNDTVDGGTDNDTIWGGAGNDVLTSGGGFDVFVFDAKPNKSTNKDKITDFSNLFDSIWLENKVFTKLGKKGSEKKPAMIKKDFFALEKAKDKDDYIIYSKKKATIYYDADGSGSKIKAVEISTVNKGATVTYADFYVI
ncbi:hypothetical protein [Microvirga sp. BSC39]|uniref:calcium-binding protein n=1 Tax=Microvirga sp. BSC39 TaxID=1549810 RepID=UPI0004E87E90|nr:hypothetical protein [Microvirga sp. BSC39]KFG67233.1 hypothetical protein JH26_24475 [Microvirga sp. BSC39]